MSNPATQWAAIFVDALIAAGLQTVCIAPGSRSTPLTLAFAKRAGQINVTTHLDERSAAFFALGRTLATDTPAALVCTSGTAAANFFPAIIEAHQSRVSLIVITADRPPELRHSGANQTIDQIKMYGDYALWAVDAALPEAETPDVAVRNLQTLAARAMMTANGIRKGVVHINMPFRKPLEPNDMSDVETQHNVTVFTTQRPRVTDERAVKELADHINGSDQHGIIVCGPRSSTDSEFHRIAAKLSEHIGFPVLADPISNARFGNINSIASYETFLATDSNLPTKPETVIRFGNVPTSKWLNNYLDNVQPKHIYHIQADGVWADDSHRVTHFIQADEMWFCEHLIEATTQKSSKSNWHVIDNETSQTIECEIDNGDYFDGAVVYDVVNLVPEESTLFVGNSLPIRHLDQFGRPSDKIIYAYANRGASGIDGNTSTALGLGSARPDHPLVAVLGDITLYHDMNGLLAVKRLGIPMTLVLLNNDGGGIFNRLPIHNFEPEFTDYFLTPHGLDYQHIARLYGLDYVLADNRATFQQAFTESVSNRLSRIIEVRTDSKQDEKRRRQIIDAVHKHLAELKV